MKDMSTFLGVAFAVLFVGKAQSEVVVWSGNGAVTESSGSFQGVAVGDVVEFRMIYNDDAGSVERWKTSSNFGGSSQAAYTSNLGLRIEVKVGELSWVGEVATGQAFQNEAFSVLEIDRVPGNERIEARIGASGGGSFSEFSVGGGAPFLNLDVVGQGDGLLAGGISAESLQEAALSAMSGVIGSMGSGDQFRFDLDVTTVEIGGVEEAVEINVVSLDREDDRVMLSWLAGAGLVYRVESTDDMASGEWTLEEHVNGTGGVLVRNFVMNGEKRFFRVVLEDGGSVNEE